MHNRRRSSSGEPPAQRGRPHSAQSTTSSRTNRSRPSKAAEASGSISKYNVAYINRSEGSENQRGRKESTTSSSDGVYESHHLGQPLQTGRPQLGPGFSMSQIRRGPQPSFMNLSHVLEASPDNSFHPVEFQRQVQAPYELHTVGLQMDDSVGRDIARKHNTQPIDTHELNLQHTQKNFSNKRIERQSDTQQIQEYRITHSPAVIAQSGHPAMNLSLSPSFSLSDDCSSNELVMGVGGAPGAGAAR